MKEQTRKQKTNLEKYFSTEKKKICKNGEVNRKKMKKKIAIKIDASKIAKLF